MAHWGSSSQPETMHFGLKKTRDNNGFSHEIACEFPNQSIEAFNPSSSSQAAASVEAATEPVANGQTCHLR